VFVLAFAIGCALSSAYGFLAGTWPFVVVEAIWSAIAVKRYVDQRREVGSSAAVSAERMAASASAPAVSSALIESRRFEGS
jgi:hypothetical protein